MYCKEKIISPKTVWVSEKGFSYIFINFHVSALQVNFQTNFSLDISTNLSCFNTICVGWPCKTGDKKISSHFILVCFSDKNGYEDVLISIHPDIPGDSVDTLITGIKKFVREGSKLLFTATKKHLYIKSVKILLPNAKANPKWNEVSQAKQTDETLKHEDAWIKVGNICFFSPLVMSKWEIPQLSQFVYFLRKVCSFFIFLNDEMHNYVKQNITVNFIIQKLKNKLIFL